MSNINSTALAKLEALSLGEHAEAVALDTDFNASFLFVGSDGDIAVTTVGGENVTFTGVPAGATLPVFCTRVASAGTTAAGLIRCWNS
ncbi:MAG: hypothetical protein AAGE83_02330 [Pseudomonadota bacterium]